MPKHRHHVRTRSSVYGVACMSEDYEYTLTDEGLRVTPSSEWHLVAGGLDMAHELLHEDETRLIYAVTYNEVDAWAGLMEFPTETVLSLMYASALSVLGHDKTIDTFTHSVPMVLEQVELPDGKQ